ncbi:uncharacterized protein BDZ99DRAFT_468874 [Mytilinidion resinicola]|uniref:Uncharacterized protein n=1 Tax=Mytilinidion resinicola TaxID=574789 RepID=A0A6A6Y176_9PEZI|nr:uncharacterized protein BDZ99DRAFT_468874 [Mytilinidion resinicola]KAF2802400.1 hypothetical protein BDZ99DRAFT_468874 [Mytilinidion resinicola]
MGPALPPICSPPYIGGSNSAFSPNRTPMLFQGPRPRAGEAGFIPPRPKETKTKMALSAVWSPGDISLNTYLSDTS